MRGLDWENTSVGAPADWPQPLRSIVRILLTSRYQMWMGWGEDLCFFYNDAYSPTLGVKHPWALGQPASVVWREIWSDVGPLVEHVMKTGESTYNEGMLLILERSGFPEETYHTFSYSPLFDEAGAVCGMLCVVVEETERIIDARRLATLRDLATATAGTTSQKQLFDATGTHLAKNRRDLPFTLLYTFDSTNGSASLATSSGTDANHGGFPKSIALGANLFDEERLKQGAHFVVIDDLQDRFGPLPTGEWPIAPKEALVVPISQQGSPELAGFLVAGVNPYRRIDTAYRDFVRLIANQLAGAIANIRGLELERQRAEELAAIDRAKTAFFSNVSHEFRTPLTLMLGPLEELLNAETVSPEHTRSQAQLAHRNGMRLLRLVNSLLDFSRIEAGRINAIYEPTDFVEFSSDIASAFRSAIEKAGLEYAIEAEPLPEPVYLDRDMWEKIVLNILSNAFKFTLRGGIKVTIAPTNDGTGAQIAIADTGIGIAANELPRLFDRFHRVEGAQGRSFEGTGIGLALVQELVRLHGGSIDVASELGVGTTFTVRIPLGHAHLPSEKVRSESQVSAAPTKVQPYVEEAIRWLPALHSTPLMSGVTEKDQAIPTGAGKRILLADDNADMREYVLRLLQSNGYEVHAASDGVAALRLARSGSFDLIVTDVMMPKLDGFGLLEAIRSDERLASTPVIMLSARAGEEARVEGIESGADDYLTKPFAARELLARIQTNIQMAAVRRDAARAILQREQQLQISRERLSRALATGRIAVYEWKPTEDRLHVHGSLGEAFGLSIDDAAKGLPIATFFDGIHPDDRAPTAALVKRTLQTNEPFVAEYRLIGGGSERTILSRGNLETLPTGERVFTGVLIDLTSEKRTEHELKERTRALQILNRAAATIAGEVKTESVVQAIVDAGVELIGAQFGAFFYNVHDEAGERYMLYSISGVPREAFSSFPMPRNTAVFAPTFNGTAIVRSDDITKDPRYGKNSPRKGMPPGHLPVCSYLAVPVRSTTNEVLGGLFFGHEEPGKFTERAEELISGLAATAAVAMDNARLIQDVQRELKQRRIAEAELQSLNATLEQRVREEVAERLRAEEALRQAQKMEAVGQLTGGVAHDFNNLLTVIIGGLDTIRRAKLTDEARIRRSTDLALLSAQRAASLTSRLLAFSRRQPLDPKPVDLNTMVRDMTELLHHTLGENIELDGVLAPRLWTAEIDQNQLESAIINLAVNARDAMPEGGKLTIETANTVLDETSAETDREVKPGEYVMVAVSDTGAGMDRETLEHAFEPFFTTKEVGKGTGLGLSMVYGFAKQSGGHVTIDSEHGQGTTVKLYFPRYSGTETSEEDYRGRHVPTAIANETILVVEDNEEVRMYSVMVLKELGYDVLEARDADEALKQLDSPRRIDLLFTDVILPGRSGRVIADIARKRRPTLRVLYTTGYSRDAIVHHGRLDPGVELIGKPFTFEGLARRVREVLDVPSPAPRGREQG